MLETQTKKLGLGEFLQQSETKPAREYMDGEVSQKPMPQIKHSLIQYELSQAINAVTKPSKIAYAFPELRCTFGTRSLVPDISVLAWERIPVDENGEVQNSFDSYPDWIIEILSPEQSITKIINKIIYCLESGTSLGWLIDREQKTIIVFPRGQQPLFFEEITQILPVLETIPDWQLTVNDIFAWLKI
jgi:Uma2 family endonuclease